MKQLHSEISEWLAAESERLKQEYIMQALYIAEDYIVTRRTFPACRIDSYDVRDGHIRIYYRSNDTIFTQGWKPLQS